MKLSQVAAQLYTTRDLCQTAQGLAETARRLRAIGYTAVQLSGIGPIADAEVVAIMQGEGLTICATHEPSQQILDEPQKAVAHLQALGCKLTAYPYPAGIDFTNADHVRTLVRKLDAAGAIFRAAGLQLLVVHLVRAHHCTTRSVKATECVFTSVSWLIALLIFSS